MAKLTALMRNKKARCIFLMLIAAAVAAVAGNSFLSQREPFLITPGPGITEIRHLRDYFGKLAGTHGDTEVYLLAGEKPGGTVLILGGTHPNEPSGHVAATVIVENVEMDCGRLFVIPRANNSAFMVSDPQEANPPSFHLETKSGKRMFRYGSRGTSPMDQWPDPDIYLHYPSGQTLSGNNQQAVQNYGTGLASQTYNQYVNNLQNQIGTGVSAAGGVASGLLGQANAQAGKSGAAANNQNATVGGAANALFPQSSLMQLLGLVGGNQAYAY